MKQFILILALSVFLTSCADEYKRSSNLQKMYPLSKVEPATGIIKEKGYDYIIIQPDNQMIGVSFYPFSETKIMSFRNVR